MKKRSRCWRILAQTVPEPEGAHSVLDACIAAERVIQKLDSRRQLEYLSDDR